MDERRFKVDYEVGVLDTKTDDIICDCQGNQGAEQVVNLLNKLDSVNKLLKLKNENLKEMFEQSEERAEHWKSLYETLYEKVEG